MQKIMDIFFNLLLTPALGMLELRGWLAGGAGVKTGCNILAGAVSYLHHEI